MGDLREGRWGRKEQRQQGGDGKADKLECVLSCCKSGSLGEQRGRGAEEVYWGGGENHMVEEIRSVNWGMEGGKGERAVSKDRGW